MLRHALEVAPMLAAGIFDRCKAEIVAQPFRWEDFFQWSRHELDGGSKATAKLGRCLARKFAHGLVLGACATVREESNLHCSFHSPRSLFTGSRHLTNVVSHV